MLKFIRYTEPKIRVNGCKRKMAEFVCDCGNVKIYDFVSVNSGRTQNCWSCSRKIASEKRKTHNLIKHPLYLKWQDMKKRCYNKNVERYKNYGARGIRVCDDWKNNFLNFYNWSIDNGYKEGLQIDRINVDGNYCPENCRYITKLENGFNKTNTFFVSVDGVKIGLSEFLYKNNQPEKYSSIWHGLKKGKSIEHYIKLYDLKTPQVKE